MSFFVRHPLQCVQWEYCQIAEYGYLSLFVRSFVLLLTARSNRLIEFLVIAIRRPSRQENEQISTNCCSVQHILYTDQPQ